MRSDLLASFGIARRLMMRDLRAQYRQSFFGVAWAFVPPLIMAAGFTMAGNARVIQISTTELAYPAYVIFSVSLWQTFVEAVNGPIQAVNDAKLMLARVNFPRESIVLAKLGEVVFNFAIKLVLIVVVFVWYQLPVTPAALLAPLALTQLILFGSLIGLLLAPLGALYQDVTRGLSLFLGLWLFLTPVVYPVPSMGAFASIVRNNPVTSLLVTTRELATTGIVSDPPRFLIISILTLIGLFVTWVIFRLAMPFAIERVSS
jgi:lipopolysaccharide transport system permease protein